MPRLADEKKYVALLTFLQRYFDQYNYAPTYEEMRVGAGLSSKCIVDRYLKKLCDDGMIQEEPNKSRTLRLTDTGKAYPNRPQQRVAAYVSKAARINATTTDRIRSIPDFWAREFAYYLNEHRHPLNRLTHMFGIPILIVTGLAGIAMLDWRMLVGGQLLGWAVQIAGHKIEGNKPALTQRPISFVMGPLMVLVEMLEQVGVHIGFARQARKIVFE